MTVSEVRSFESKNSKAAGRRRHLVAGLAKFVVRRHSTIVQLKKFDQALKNLIYGAVNNIIHGSKLKVYCHNKTGLLLNVGCGDHIEDGWINIDQSPKGAAFFHNILDTLPIANQSVSYIHAEHVLEHLEFSDSMLFLRDCHRVLQTGGKLRVVVPDSAKYMIAYANNDQAFFGNLKHLGGTPEPLPTKAAICNQMFHMASHHQFGWDFETLEYAANTIGFRRIVQSFQYDGSLAHCIDRPEWWRPIESLYAIITR